MRVIIPVLVGAFLLAACQSGIQIEPVGVAPSLVKAPESVPLRQDRVTSAAVLHLRDQLTQNALASQALEDKLGAYQSQGYELVDEGAPEAVRLARIFAEVHQRSHLANMALKPLLIERDLFQAYTLGGLEIVFYTGLTSRLSDDGLAIIIGHEIAHIATSHAVESISRDVVNLSHRHNEEANLAGFYAIESEYEADMVGLLYASLAGYDPRKAAEIWETLSGVAHRPKFDLFTSTHPPDDARAKRLSVMAQKLGDLRGAEDWQAALICNPLYCAD